MSLWMSVHQMALYCLPYCKVYYMNDCRGNYKDRHIVKITDGTTMLSLLWDEYGPVDKDLVDWCGDCFIQLNTLKTNGEAKRL